MLPNPSPGDVHDSAVAVVEDVVLVGVAGGGDGEGFVVGGAGFAQRGDLAHGGLEEFVVGEGGGHDDQARAGSVLDDFFAGCADAEVALGFGFTALQARAVATGGGDKQN